MMFKSVIAALAATPLVSTQELMRFGCSQLTFDQLDPLVEPGALPSGHMHQVIGGNSFNATMLPDHDPPKRATCTSCTYSEDFSNYWTPNLYFRHKNNTLKHVPIFTNLGLGVKGGMTVYYIRGYTASQKVTAFKPGFRMVVGDPSNRDQGKMQKQLCYRCEANKQQQPFGGAPCSGADTKTFPKQACGGGWRVSIHFPTCWDGKNLDSANHKDHIVYPAQGSFESGGACPQSHPVRMPQLMYEIMFDTSPFNNKDWWVDGDISKTFVWSNGDTTGAGLHGDYLFGWKDDSLQQAMDTKCSGDRCRALQRQSDADAIACTQPPQAAINYDADGWMTTLPGGIPVGGNMANMA